MNHVFRTSFEALLHRRAGHLYRVTWKEEIAYVWASQPRYATAAAMIAFGAKVTDPHDIDLALLAEEVAKLSPEQQQRIRELLREKTG